MGGGVSVHPKYAVQDDPQLGNEAFLRSQKPETWENHGKAVYIERYGIEEYNKRVLTQFPPAPRRTCLERHGLDMKILKIKSLMSFAALARGLRPTHSTGIGAVGEGVVLPNSNIPNNAFFKPGTSFPLRIRHSNALGTYDHDGGFEPRGMSIKFGDSTAASPMDIVLNTGEMMGFFNVDTFMEFTSAQLSGDDGIFGEFNHKYPSAIVSAIGSYRRAPNSYHDLHYYSQVCFQFEAEDGRARICRFRAVPYGDGPGTPVAPEQSGLPDLKDQRDSSRMHPLKFGFPRQKDVPKTYLQDEYKRRVAAGKAIYRLQIQFHEITDGVSHEIYNPNVPWDSAQHPFHDLMEIKMNLVLDSNETEQMRFQAHNLVSSTLKVIPAYSKSDYNSILVCRAKVYAASQSLRGITRKKIPLPPNTPTKSYIVETETYAEIFEGTSKPIFLSIIGTKGTTTAVRLNHDFDFNLRPGAKDSFLIEGEDVGEVVAIRVEKATNDNDCWRVKSISIQFSQQKIFFSCACWVEFGSNFFLRSDKGVLDATNAQDVSLHRKLLLTNQQRWVWSSDPAGQLPQHGSESDMFKLPIDHQFSINRFVSFGLIAQEAKFNSFFATKLTSLRTFWDSISLPSVSEPIQSKDSAFRYPPDRLTPVNRVLSIDDFSRSNLFGNLTVPERSSRWRSDVEFADKMISGANPICLRNITSIPVGFNLTSERVQHLIPDGETLETQMAAGRVFFIDHGPALEGIPLWTTQIARDIMSKQEDISLDETPRYAPPVQGLFHVHPNIEGRPRLMPLAIQLLKGPGQAVYVPKDLNPSGDRIDLDWLVAKTFFLVSDCQVHQMLTHLFSTHLIMEPFVVAMERNLPTVHPVNKLLHHHIVGTVAINTFGRSVLIAPGGLADICMSTGGGGHIQMMINYYKNGIDGQGLNFFTRFNHQKFCTFRGVDDPIKLPNYMYRDDGLTMWNAIQAYVSAFLSIHYSSDAAVIADSEVQNWVSDLRKNAFVAGRLPDFPGNFPTLASLVEFVTILIFQLSCGHAAVNFCQWDEYAHVPSHPTSALRAPPTGPGQFNMGDFMDIFPTLPMVRQQIITAFTLGTFNDAERYLGEFEDEIFSESERVVVAQFQDSLKSIDADMCKRNTSAVEKGLQVSGDAYPYMRPTRVPNSIAI